MQTEEAAIQRESGDGGETMRTGWQHHRISNTRLFLDPRDARWGEEDVWGSEELYPRERVLQTILPEVLWPQTTLPTLPALSSTSNQHSGFTYRQSFEIWTHMSRQALSNDQLCLKLRFWYWMLLAVESSPKLTFILNQPRSICGILSGLQSLLGSRRDPFCGESWRELLSSW